MSLRLYQVAIHAMYSVHQATLLVPWKSNVAGAYY